MQTFVPKSRRPKFEFNLKIIDLNNVPLVSGTSYIKWHLPHSAAAEHRGRTSKCHIRDHKVIYDYEKTLQVRLTVDRNNVLDAMDIHLEVIQEYTLGARSEKIVLGKIKLNLAEYVETSEFEGEEGIQRRYLMQDSKINSTLKIGIHMRLIEGERSFVAPALKTAPVFGGIAGIMSGEQGEAEEAGNVSSINANTREMGEVQDMYRRNLAAYMTAQPGELKADECIEDIFNGGDGWGRNESARDAPPRTGAKYDHPEIKSRYGHRRSGSVESLMSGQTTPRPHSRHQPHHSRGLSGRQSLEHHANNIKAEAAYHPTKASGDADELELREDLRSWKLPDFAT